jgi:microcystin degradation protein MlrC
MKVFASGIATETNTFSPIPTGLGDFAVCRAGKSETETGAEPPFDLETIWGDPVRARGDDFVFGLMAFAQPAGVTVRQAYEALREELLRKLQKALPVDVVLLMLHGAMVADGYDDCEEDLVERVRAMVGPETIIGVELDLHCHLSESLLKTANLVVIYKEYPHTDCNDRAHELLELATSAREGKIRPVTALYDCRMIGLYPTKRQPMRSFVDAMSDAERRPGVLSVSFGHGFPFADLPHVGSKVIAITDGDPGLADQVAREFGRRAYDLRHEIGFEGLSIPLEEALPKALASSKLPVVVADQSDNAGGGAPGDSTFALRWLLDHDVEDVAMAILYDPSVVGLAKKAGIGASLPVRLGGKMGPFSGNPIDLDVTVTALRENYAHAFPQESGEPMLFAAGDVVALRHGTIDIVVSSERCQCYSPEIFSDLGIELASKRLVIPKSFLHFYSAFAPIAGEVIFMASAGAVAPDPRQVPYRRLATSGMYPWIESPL